MNNRHLFPTTANRLASTRLLAMTSLIALVVAFLAAAPTPAHATDECLIDTDGSGAPSAGDTIDGSTGLATSLACGDTNDASAVDSIAVGRNNDIDATDATGIGNGNDIDAGSNFSTAIGDGNTITSNSSFSVAIGQGSSVGMGTGSTNSIAIGRTATVGATAGGMDGIAIGRTAAVDESFGIAIGFGADVEDMANQAIAIGQAASVDGAQAIAIGDVATANGTQAIAIGNSAAAPGANTVSLGAFAGQLSSGSGHVFLGHNAGKNESGEQKLYIENTDSADPLIYGEFDNDIVGINGTLGVGTESPGEAVDVVQDGGARFQLSSFSSTATDAAQYIQRRARGTQAAPASVQSGDNIGLFSFRGMRPNGLFSGSKAAITVQATQNWQNSQNGTSIKFGTTQNGTSTLSTVMEITHDKKVKINGTTLNIPDYVFEDEYDLMPLDELKVYIEKNKHLPNMASAEQVKRDGIDLGGSQMALLEKIEELTLYTLRQEARIEAQQVEIGKLREMVNRLVTNDQLAALN